MWGRLLLSLTASVPRRESSQTVARALAADLAQVLAGDNPWTADTQYHARVKGPRACPAHNLTAAQMQLLPKPKASIAFLRGTKVERAVRSLHTSAHISSRSGSMTNQTICDLSPPISQEPMIVSIRPKSTHVLKGHFGWYYILTFLSPQ